MVCIFYFTKLTGTKKSFPVILSKKRNWRSKHFLELLFTGPAWKVIHGLLFLCLWKLTKQTAAYEWSDNIFREITDTSFLFFFWRYGEKGFLLVCWSVHALDHPQYTGFSFNRRAWWYLYTRPWNFFRLILNVGVLLICFFLLLFVSEQKILVLTLSDRAWHRSGKIVFNILVCLLNFH